MRLNLLVTAVAALTMAMLVTMNRTDPDAPHPSLTNSTESDKPGAQTPERPSTFDREVEPGLVERLADDPHAALEWLLQSSSREQRALLSAGPDLQQAIIDAADRLMQTARPQSGNEHAVALEHFVQLWAAVDLRSAYEWVYQIPAGPVRNALMVRVAFAESQSSPAEAARRVVDEIPPGITQEEAVVMVLHQWAIRDPDSAAAWVNLFPDNQFRERALRELDGVTSYRRASVAAP